MPDDLYVLLLYLIIHIFSMTFFSFLCTLSKKWHKNTPEIFLLRTFPTSYAIKNSDSGKSRIATISDIQQLNNDENIPHEVTFTNNKDAIPDAGLDLNTTPYIRGLGIVAAGAGVLLFRRRKSWS